MVKVAILGIGTVGGGTAEVLTKNRELIARRAGQEIELKYILCRKPRPDHPFAHLIVHDIDTIVNDDEIGVVAECIGGATLAYQYAAAWRRARTWSRPTRSWWRKRAWSLPPSPGKRA